MNQRSDVIVIGGGLAACMAAIEAAKHGLNVTLVDKGVVGRSGSTPNAGGGAAAFLSGFPWGPYSGDSKEAHYDDFMSEGRMINDPTLVRCVVEEGGERILELEKIGIPFSRHNDGRRICVRTFGHSHPRTYIAQGEGFGMMEGLRKEAFHRRVHVIEGMMIAKVFVSNGCSAGVLGVEVSSGQPHILGAKAVVLSPGSATGLYQFASAPFRTTGDGLAVAYEAGVRLANPEFMEFTVVPKVGRKVLASGSIAPFMGRGSRLFNAKGERIMKRYDPQRMEVTSRCILVRAIWQEMAQGRGPVYNDCSHFSKSDWTDMESSGSGSLARKLASMGLDYRKDRFEWMPAVHTLLGGIVMNERCETNIEGVYAAGEVTNGVHGANRCSGNAFTECLVLGRRAGRNAALFALKARPPVIAKKEITKASQRIKAFYKSSGENPFEVEKTLRKLASEFLGVGRAANGLKQALGKVKQLQETPLKVSSTAELIKAMEVKNLLFTAEMVARGALQREESRGQHYRDDYPEELAKWLKWTTVEKNLRGMKIALETAPTAI